MYIPHKLSWSRWLGLSTSLIIITVLLAPSAGIHALPDSRAWEMVSPLEKNGGEVRDIDGIGEGGVVQASEDGSRVTYTSFSAFAEAQGAPLANQYLSTRSDQGWATQSLNTQSSQAEYSITGAGGPYKAFSASLSKGLLFAGKVGVLPGEPLGYPDYRLRDNQTGQYTPLLTVAPLGFGGAPLAGELSLEFVSATSGLDHILFKSPAALTGNAVYNEEANEYEWINGRLEAINVLPGAPHNETSPNRQALVFGSHIMSSDGARVFWTSEAAGPPRSLYVRDGVGTSQARSVQVDVSHGSGVSGNGVFQEASGDGSRVFFLCKERLTPDSTAGGVEAHADLYEFDVPRNELRDLTVDNNPGDPDGASALGVMGASDDGSYMYFVAEGALPQASANNTGQRPESGVPNVYLAHNGNLTYITKLTNHDEERGQAKDWRNNVYERTTRVSVDGKSLVFMAAENLKGYDSEGMQEVYLYKADGNDLTCVSCNPTGGAPQGPSSIPAGTGFQLNNAIYQSRVLTDDSSRVFFDSKDALVPQDTNSRQDVYEWELEGAGSCTSSSVGFSASSGGCVSLISGGTYNADSTFVDASSSGSDVFFITGQQLVSQDTDELTDLYDARENGGFTPPPSPPACSGTGCQGAPPAPPIFATPATATFAGEGNPAAPTAVKPAVKPKALTRAQKLAGALKACGRKPRGKRAACRTQARKRYGAVKKRK